MFLWAEKWLGYEHWVSWRYLCLEYIYSLVSMHKIEANTDFSCFEETIIELYNDLSPIFALLERTTLNSILLSSKTSVIQISFLFTFQNDPLKTVCLELKLPCQTVRPLITHSSSTKLRQSEPTGWNTSSNILLFARTSTKLIRRMLFYQMGR